MSYDAGPCSDFVDTTVTQFSPSTDQSKDCLYARAPVRNYGESNQKGLAEYPIQPRSVGTFFQRINVHQWCRSVQ